MSTCLHLQFQTADDAALFPTRPGRTAQPFLSLSWKEYSEQLPSATAGFFPQLLPQEVHF